MKSQYKFKTTSMSALALVLALGSQAYAQDETETDQGEFLGTIKLGESKRAVDTSTAVPVTVIGSEEINDRQAGTIAELIETIPGVSLVNGSTPTGSGIAIRGFGANGTFGTDQKVAVLVDGATTGGEELYRIGTQLFTDPYLYKSVQVQRGTVGSFEYGSGIVGGIVLLETINASDLTGGEPGFKWAQTLGLATNNEGRSLSTTVAWQPLENLEFLANYSYREQSEQKDGDGDLIGNSAFELPSYLAKAKLTFGDSNDQSVTASVTRTETAERDVPYDQFGLGSGYFGNVDRDITSETAGLVYEYTPANSNLFDLSVALTYANQVIDQSPVGGPSSLLDADHQYETTKLTVKNGSYLETGSVSHSLRYGFEVLKKERADASSAPGGTDKRFAVFLIDDMELTEGLNFTPALRYEAQELEHPTITLNHNSLMGGASLRYEFESGLALFTSYAYTESLPILDDILVVAKRDVPEIATTYEAGVSYDHVGFLGEGNALALKLNYYDTNLDDVTSYSSVAEIDLQGFELEGSFALASGAYFDLNANIVSGEEIRTNGDVFDWRNIPQDTLRLSAGQRIGDVADFSAEVLMAFEKDITGLASTPTSDGSGFTTLNLRSTLTPQEGIFKGLEIRIGMENVFDTQYTPMLATRPAPGRNFKVTFTKVFF
ncbi:MAG: TonB-dependent receptor [Parvibaculaceae bacterium]|nr:TonB-dependent receptor [Parvibaculaceae bacterium]